MQFLKKLFGGSQEPKIPDFPFELIVVRGVGALTELKRLEELGKSECFRPVIVGDEEEFDFFADQFECAEQTHDEILDASRTIIPDDFFKERAAEDPEYYQAEPGDPAPNESESGELTAHLNPLTRKPKPWVFIAKIPGRDASHIPAHFRYGGWNECPMPGEHVAVWKYWEEKYGAEIVCVTHDIIEAKVANPPKNFEQAYVLSQEQFLYCADIVHQGVQTLENLAAMLQNGRTWYFWWD